MIRGPTVITGASRGIGRTIATRVAQEGGALGLWALKRPSLEQLAEELAGIASRVHVEAFDITEEAAVRRAAATTEAALGGICSVVNNAGVSFPEPFDLLAVEEWDRMFAVNCRSIFLVTKFTLPAMRRMGGGCYVNISSDVGRENQAGFVGYGASKFAVVGFTQGLSRELAAEGIRVNSVAPGPVETDMFETMLTTRMSVEHKTPQELRAAILEGIPTKRFPTARDVAETVAFLLDNERSGSITGECLLVCGGGTVR